MTLHTNFSIIIQH